MKTKSSFPFCGITDLDNSFNWQRMDRLSRFKDLGDSRADELNRALKRLPAVDESRDSWRSPRVERARILSAYLDTRPEVVLEEDSSLIQGDTAWAMVSEHIERLLSSRPYKISFGVPIIFNKIFFFFHLDQNHRDSTGENRKFAADLSLQIQTA